MYWTKIWRESLERRPIATLKVAQLTADGHLTGTLVTVLELAGEELVLNPKMEGDLARESLGRKEIATFKAARSSLQTIRLVILTTMRR